MTPRAATHSYAVRRVNPFEGVLQIVQTDAARAYSSDGQVWQIQVLARRPDHTWRSFSHIEPIEQFFNFGLWDRENGLYRIPANPIMDLGGMRRAADALTAELRSVSERLPLPLADIHECWASDYDGRPIALLATCESPQLANSLRVERWHATRLPDHAFVSQTLLAARIPNAGDMGPRQHAARLERLVRQTAQRKIWFTRRPDGGGEVLLGGSDSMPHGHDAFPPLGLKTDWQDPVERGLAEDYVAWIAPYLLTLQHLDDTQRRTLERFACARATELAACYRLIPAIVDHQAIDAARVEARLRDAAP